jgi:hypothetical protein
VVCELDCVTCSIFTRFVLFLALCVCTEFHTSVYVPHHAAQGNANNRDDSVSINTKHSACEDKQGLNRDVSMTHDGDSGSHHREITPYYGKFVTPQTAAREVNRRGLHSDWCEETTR